MILEGDAKFYFIYFIFFFVMQNLKKKKWLAIWKITWRIWQISRLGLLRGTFIQNRKCVSLKCTGELYVMTMKNDAKFKKELACHFKIDMRNLTNFDLSTQKHHFKFALIYYLMFEPKNYRGVMFDDTKNWSKTWRKTDLCFQKGHEEFVKVSLEHLKVSKLGLWWDSFIQSRKCLSLKFTRE